MKPVRYLLGFAFLMTLVACSGVATPVSKDQPTAEPTAKPETALPQEQTSSPPAVLATPTSFSELREFSFQTDTLFRTLKSAQARRTAHDDMKWKAFRERVQPQIDNLKSRYQGFEPMEAKLKVGSLVGYLETYFLDLTFKRDDPKKLNEFRAYCEGLVRERDEYLESVEPFRTFSDKTGKFATIAKFRSSNGAVVTLEKEDGTTVDVPVSKLSDEDREWIQDQR
jgi:hypothetical protein